MWVVVKTILLLHFLFSVLCKIDEDLVNQHVLTTKSFAVWENASVPFYINNDHFDHEQTTQILTALSMFAFKTCIKFMPVMAPPTTEDVLVFQNPEASRRCVINTKGHSVFKPHTVDLGYDCLESPQIDMLVMKALGFPFEHNRINRDEYIEVLQENIEPGAIELFTKEDTLPMELRFLPYDINSVMHFGTRDYSKNGHRTIIIKDHNSKQNRVGLSHTDLKKIEIIYGPLCRNRDRQEKIELCQSYPGVARKKRDVGNIPTTPEKLVNEEELATKSLRVNPNITPPPDGQTDESDVIESFKDLGIDDEVQKIVENAYKIAELALRNAREKYCNNNSSEMEKPNLNSDNNTTHKHSNRSSSDILGIIEVVGEYARDMVNSAMTNLTKFCDDSGNIEVYQRARCDYGKGDRCPLFYKSTKTGYVKYSTQHRPVYYMSTKHSGNPYKFKHYGRSGNDTEDLVASTSVRRKREAETAESTATVALVDDNKRETNTEEKVNDVTEKMTTAVDEKSDPLRETSGRTEENAEAARPTETAKEITESRKEKKDAEKEKDNLRMGTAPPGQKQYLYDRRSSSRKREEYDNDETERVVSKKKRSKGSLQERRPRKNKRYEKERKREERVPVEDEEEIPRDEMKRPRKGHDRIEPKKDEIDISTEVKTKKKPQDDEVRRPPKKGELERKRPRDSRGRKQPREQQERKRPKESNNPLKEREEIPKKIRNKKREREETEDSYIEAVAPRRPKKSQSNRGKTSLPETVELSKANSEFYNERKWPEGTVWYMIQEDTTYDTNDMRRRLEEVNRILKEKTCVKLVEITPGQANKYEDYIVIDNSPDYVTGRVGGKQNFGSIELFRGDQHRQHTAMMVMAMLGFYFEVARHDRDQYVRVHMRHVRPDKLHHFEKIRSDATLALPYDFASATHPAWQFWRQLGRTGISTVATFKEQDADGKIMKSLGQNRKLLSDTDIIKINSVYGIECFKNTRAKDSQMAQETLDIAVE